MGNFCATAKPVQTLTDLAKPLAKPLAKAGKGVTALINKTKSKCTDGPAPSAVDEDTIVTEDTKQAFTSAPPTTLTTTMTTGTFDSDSDSDDDSDEDSEEESVEEESIVPTAKEKAFSAPPPLSSSPGNSSSPPKRRATIADPGASPAFGVMAKCPASVYQNHVKYARSMSLGANPNTVGAAGFKEDQIQMETAQQAFSAPPPPPSPKPSPAKGSKSSPQPANNTPKKSALSSRPAAPRSAGFGSPGTSGTGGGQAGGENASVMAMLQSGAKPIMCVVYAFPVNEQTMAQIAEIERKRQKT